MTIPNIDPRPAGNILPMTLLGTSWATCCMPRAKPDQEAKWVLPLPGIVSVVDLFRRLHDARACENVAELVRVYREAGIYDRAGRYRLAWSYASGMERISVLERAFFTLAERQLAEVARDVEMDELLGRLRCVVRS